MTSIWKSPVFLGVYGDPYLRNTPYEFGGNPQALVATLDALMFFINPANHKKDVMVFPLSSVQEYFLQSSLLPQLQRCKEWTDKGMKISDAKQFQVFLKEWHTYLGTLQIGTPILVPGGYVGNITSHTIIYIVEKMDDEYYSFTVCNKGPGAEMYHPSFVKPTSETNITSECDKITVQPYVQVTRIPSIRFLDMAFWSLLFSLWTRKPPSEYHRVETIYDVILPWLAGDQLLPISMEETATAWQRTGDAAYGIVQQGRTVQRSNLGYCKSVLEAVRYLCLVKGAFTREEIKYSLLYQLRYRLLERTERDLQVRKNPEKGIPTDAMEKALRILASISLLDALQGSHSLQSIPSNAVVALYYAKAGHGGCHQLNKHLIPLTNKLHHAGNPFIVIVVSVDQEQADYTKFMENLPSHSWLMVPFADIEARKQLIEAFSVQSLPTLIIRDAEGNILTPKGKDLILSDPEGLSFPWSHEMGFKLPVDTITYSDRKCIDMALKQTGLKTLRLHREGSFISTVALDHVNALMDRIEALGEELKMSADDTDKETETSTVASEFSFLSHSNMELLQLKGRENDYAGNAADMNIPDLGSFLDVPERVTSIPLAVAAFVRCYNLCESLLRRAADGSSSSRISLHHEVIQLITSVFIEVLPVPKPSKDKDSCMWRQCVQKEMQLKCLNHISSLLMILGSVWQSMEQPTRQFDSERALASICALAIFDALLRTPASDAPLEISLMMESDGGYVLAHRFCKANFTLRKTAACMEFTRPQCGITRGNVIAYFEYQDSISKHTFLYDYPMPEDKIELKRYSTTLVFFQQLMERYHYPLIDPSNETPPTEMEALVEWFCGDENESRMSREHPEVPLVRDVVMMVKFLATMETKEIELMRRRQGGDHYQMWQLTFEDNASTHRRYFFGSRGLDRMLNGQLKWEVVNIRGTDQDIVDLDVLGFMERKVFFGESPVIKSPIELGTILVSDIKCSSQARSLPPQVTEDDIMHLDYLPSFGGTLSSEEAEYLLSFLTVPYARIPLILSFFASRDRVTYLFNPSLQQLFRAVLFESGDWVSEEHHEEIASIPLRKSSVLLREEAMDRVYDARLSHQKCEDHLGTMHGLLLNELVHAPQVIMEPLLKMLNSIRELGEASVHSADARFILFMIKLGMDVLRYATFTIDSLITGDRAKYLILEQYRSQLIAFGFGFALDTLEKWRCEAEATNNLQTACVIHSYAVLLYVGLRSSEYTVDRVARMIGSIAYVRNWHCFGMKVLVEGNEGGASNNHNGLSAEDRLLRWLQAQGINTENIAKSSLDKYLKGRPLYLKIGMQTVQAPSIIALRSTIDGEELKLPPGEVLEVEMFEALQIHRRGMIKWLNTISKETVAQTLGQMVRIALRSNEPDDTWSWQTSIEVGNVGRYHCIKTELKLDVQTGEILWRNDELKPVPDGMTQYADFKTLFGNKSLHCGLVIRQEHRLWIKIIGTDYELIEWDDPVDKIDQGIGAPIVKPYEEISSDTNDSPEELKMYWECPACTCANFNGDNVNATCEVCGTPRFNRPAPSMQGANNAETKPKQGGFEYNGQIFSRPWDIYDEETEHPHVEEQWFVDLVGNTMRLLYPPDSEDKKLPFTLFLPKQPLVSTSHCVHILGLDQGNKEKQDREKIDTFKEIVAFRTHQVVHIYALVSHGRRMFRKLIFSSSCRLSLHGFPLTCVQPDASAVNPLLLCAGGEPRERQSVGGSLVVLRRNRLLGGTEQFVPPRLLQGIVPTCLLETFQFWMGEDGSIRGDPMDVKSQWFRYRVQIDMKANGSAQISRRSIKTSFTRIGQNGILNTMVTVNATRPPPAPTRMTSRTTTAAPVAQINDEDVVQLMAMGFSYNACGLALRECHGNVGMSAAWLLDESNQLRIVQAEYCDDMNEPMLTEEENIGILMSLETLPSRAVVDYAMNIFNKDVDLARAWLEDPGNADEIARVDTATSARQSSERIVSMDVDDESKHDDDATMEIVEESVGNALYLLNLLDAKSEDADVCRMLTLLCRLEDLSHILVWCHLVDNKIGDSISIASVAFVELPRLKIKLAPSYAGSNTIRFEIMDQNGWFISPSRARHSNQYLDSLMTISPDSWLLESDTNDLKILCPNHDAYRPRVEGEPLGNLVVADRASMGWQQVMETRFYTYPIHSSHTFLLPPSLSSTLYLILISLLSRKYGIAMDFIQGCNVDVKWTDEEKWIFDQFAKTLDDRNPNACACRIRLTLCMVYSENKVPWKLSHEMQDYMNAVAHVDAVCKLTVDEEKEALAQCHQQSPLLLLRKLWCDHEESIVDFKLSRGRVGGQPWVKLQMYNAAYLAEHGKKLSTVRYNRPKHNANVIDEEEAGKLVWNCAIVGDEISGSNRGLGFLFLYECLNRQVTLTLGGQDCTRSFGDLHTRFLHLKLSRWGRETIDEGEEESSPSLAIAQLAMMVAHPYQEWANTPTDSESTRMLSFGANLYSKMTFGSIVKSFFEFGEVEFQSKLSSDDHQRRIVTPLKAQFNQAHKTTDHIVKIQIVKNNVQHGDPFGPTNTTCTSRTFVSRALINPEFPLEGIDVQQYITFCDPEMILNPGLPFDLSQHPAAQTVAAKDLLKRLGDDITANATAINNGKEVFLRGVTPLDLVRGGPMGAPPALARVEQLIKQCESLRLSDRQKVDEAIISIEKHANTVKMASTELQKAETSRFVMERRIGLFPMVQFDFLTSLISSDAFTRDLLRRNPFFALDSSEDSSCGQIVEQILTVLFMCSRIVQINRTIQLARTLVRRLHDVTQSSISEAQVIIKQTLQTSKDLADAMLSKRHYLSTEPYQWSFDPRFLVFEYVFDLLLRRRQVQMIQSFLESLQNGQSRVQQMIMGAGKTTVVGPLLTYILADKLHLVTHVMPTALLEQSRQVLRSRFSNAVLRKRIFTFEFDRSIPDDPHHVIQMYEKLNRARQHGDVVCASPESIKSMMLKLVELLHSLEESSNVIQLPLSKVQISPNLRRIRRILEDRSEMSDELYKTIRLWQNGILIMDEVDVLLHPLRSELNFPIGNKFPIDLAANRWELPIHLIDAVLCTEPSQYVDQLRFQEIQNVLIKGYDIHALQRFPHLVLLDIEFYQVHMMPLMIEIALQWLLTHFKMAKMEITIDLIKYYLVCPRHELYQEGLTTIRIQIEQGLSESSVQLLNFTRDWLHTLLPHILSKINRVSYGLLRGDYQTAAASGTSGGNSHSRLLLAVPFVGKDVPSRSSEFAHPDVLIGLTILAYRYEGIRISDLVRIVMQLKQDFTRQLGPRDQRPACVMFREWVLTGLEHDGSKGNGVLPLPLFQLRDTSQVTRLHVLVYKLAGIVYYYLRQHVFPSCMNFQKLKISACGHELGSNVLFSKRIGFSGTPSNLLPLDLGECYYEPCSDGSIFQSLTSPRIVSIERKVNWTARSLLLDIAHAKDPPIHALIDTGALITGFENHEVAAFLLEHLDRAMEGVVYLDNQDRQMILLRDHNAPLPLVQCGLSPTKRFTFYDQVHTTGMDIKQCVNARAVLTLGKDMTFRDYAQGAYRMRGIETGQSIHLFLIPEVENRICHEMALVGMETSTRTLESLLLLVPAWLLINSMRMESMQLVQLSLQELHNTWRKRALYSLMDNIGMVYELRKQGKVVSTTTRLNRFIGDDEEKHWLRECVARFREEISYAVETVVPTKRELKDVIETLVNKNRLFLRTEDEIQRVEDVKARLVHSSSQEIGDDTAEHGNMRLTAEVVHENEQEAEEEAEEEAEQEEQKMSAFARDDEHPIPWSPSILGIQPTEKEGEEDGVMYPLSKFQAHNECPCIAFPTNLLISGNFFRRRWVGLGERRVKNIGLILEWSPLAEQEIMKKIVQHYFMTVLAQQPNLAPNDAVVKALALAFEISRQPMNELPAQLINDVTGTMNQMPVYLIAISLAEGETVRRMIHKNHSILKLSQIRLRTCEGELIESSSCIARWSIDYTMIKQVDVGFQLLRFFNNEMYYTPNELEKLLEGLDNVPISLRLDFFESLLRLRRRERHLWGDTPLAKVFTRKDEWYLLGARARMQQFQQSLKLKKRKVHFATALRRFDENGDGRLNVDETLKCFESFQLGYSSGELKEIIALIADASQFEDSRGGVLMETICAAFGISKAQMDDELRREDIKLALETHEGDTKWSCSVCTFVNDASATICNACNEPNPIVQDDGTKSMSQHGWQCGNCTFINLPDEVTCVICECGMDGHRAVPRGKWVCAGEQGGCTFFNSNSNFYCEVCNRARPDLSSTRF